MFSYDPFFGIKLLNSSLYLDAGRVVDFSFVSHGHTDHVRNHRQILATPVTGRIHTLRGKRSKVVALDYNTPLEMDGLTIELLPAGHILGSAQIYVERDGFSLLYTGDFKMRRGVTCEPLQVRHADVLVMECTYGRPEYRFASQEELVESLAAFVTNCSRWGEVPVVLAYSLGKAQEAMYWLHELGVEVYVSNSVAQMAAVYEEFGVKLGPYRLWDGGPVGDGALVLPPHSLRKRNLDDLGDFRTLLLSGWAADPAGRARYQADEAIAFSDHADFAELLEFVSRVAPRQVFTIHGFDDFPVYLRAAGFNASPLRPTEQLSLF